MTGAPSRTFTRNSRRPSWAAKNTWSSAIQVPVTPVVTSQIVVVVPVTNEYVLTLSFVRKPSERPSGEKNGWSAPSVPASGRISKLSSSRANNRTLPFGDDPTHTSVRPSGDRSSNVESKPTSAAAASRARNASGGTLISVLTRAAGPVATGAGLRRKTVTSEPPTTPRSRPAARSTAAEGRKRRPPRLHSVATFRQSDGVEKLEARIADIAKPLVDILLKTASHDAEDRRRCDLGQRLPVGFTLDDPRHRL